MATSTDFHFDEQAAHRPVGFFESNLRHVKGDLYGKPSSRSNGRSRTSCTRSSGGSGQTAIASTGTPISRSPERWGNRLWRLALAWLALPLTASTAPR